MMQVKVAQLQYKKKTAGKIYEKKTKTFYSTCLMGARKLFSHLPYALLYHQFQSQELFPKSLALLCTADFLQLQTHRSSQV